jgi:predicted RNA binding protein YcfA (HicA-like mRNA interferase family)
VRGGTYFSLPAAKKSRQKKAGSHRQLVGVDRCTVIVSGPKTSSALAPHY